MRLFFRAASIVTITAAEVVTARLSIGNTPSKGREIAMNEFARLIDELAPIVAQRAARSRATGAERDRRLARQAFEVEMERLNSRIRSGRSAFAKSLAPVVKALGDMQADAKIQAAADQAQRESQEREAKAAKLKEILAAVDKGIADGSLTAEQVALLEKKIHAAAQRLGAV
jgi:hypothetical protein